MTFPANLERLPFTTNLERYLKEATEGPWHTGCRQIEDDSGALVASLSGWRNDAVSKTNAELIALLRNHADAILRLVRAAEDALLALNMGLGQTDAEYDDAIKQAIKARDALTQEFAKLNGEGK